MLDYPKIDNSAVYQTVKGKRRLSASFRPGPFDCICARGKDAYDHVGNKRFRDLIKLYHAQYAAVSSCKFLKSKIVSRIVETVRSASPNGGFVKRIDGVWYTLDDRAVKEKVGQCFRDGLHKLYSSSTKAKAKVRQMRRSSGFDSDGPVTQSQEQSSPSIVSDDFRSFSPSDTLEDDGMPSPATLKTKIAIEFAAELRHAMTPFMPTLASNQTATPPRAKIFGSQRFYPVDMEDDSLSVLDEEPALDTTMDKQQPHKLVFDDRNKLHDDYMKWVFCEVMGVSKTI